MNFKIKILTTEEDVTALFLLFHEIFPHFSWSKEDFLRTFKNPQSLLVGAFLENELVGGSQFSYLFEEAELLNIAVAKKVQKKGLGSSLIQKGQQELACFGVEKIFLEVRESNLSAQKLYEKNGFLLLSRRKNYYHHPLEDALIYCQDSLSKE